MVLLPPNAADLMCHRVTPGDVGHSGRGSRAVVGGVLVVSQDCAMFGVAPAQCRLPPVSQRTRRHHWHLVTRAAGSHGDRDAAHGPAAGTRDAREAGMSPVSNTFRFMKTCTSYSTKSLHEAKSLQHNGPSAGAATPREPPGALRQQPPPGPAASPAATITSRQRPANVKRLLMIAGLAGRTG